MKELEYDEFEVLLERSGDGYTARVVESPTGSVPALPFVPPEPPGGLPALQLAVRGGSEPAAGPPLEASTRAAPVAQRPKQFGAELFRALFNDRALAILRTSQFVSSRRQRGLRLRIRFADATPLANLPWELLYDPERHWFPCQLSRFPTIRFVDIPEPVLPLEVSGPLRMLVAISSPSDLPLLDVEKEWTLLRTEMEPLVRAGRLELERLPIASLEAVRETLLRREFHIFHYIGHGGVDPSTGEGQLAFTGTDGRQRRVTGSQLGVMLSNSPIRLAVLNSCEGGRISDVDPYASTAITLVEQGIPAVVAMQFQISDVAATAFSRTFYDSVTSGRPVDLAVTLARQAVLAASETEWATPVLYLHAEDGVLFDLTPRQEATEPVSEPVSKPVSKPVSQPVSKPEPAVAGLAAPEGLHVHVVDGVVDLVWHQPPMGLSLVTTWEVWRNGARVAVVDKPALRDRPPGPGAYQYRVVALGGDRTSPPSDDVVVLLNPPVEEPAPPRGGAAAAYARGAAPGGPRPPDDGEGGRGGAGGGAVPAGGGPPVRRRHPIRWLLVLLVPIGLGLGLLMLLRGTEVPAPGPTASPNAVSPPGRVQQDQGPAAPEADLWITKTELSQIARNVYLLDFRTGNGGPSEISGERVTVTLNGMGRLAEPTVVRPGESNKQACSLDSDTQATCDVGSHATGETATVEVRVELEGGPAEVTASASSSTNDRIHGNDSVPVTVPGPTQPGGST